LQSETKYISLYGCENVYSDIGEFGITQHVQLSEILKDSKATWMLSYGDHAVIRDLYKEFNITECTVKYSGLGNSGVNQYDAPELIITNYDPPNDKSLFNEANLQDPVNIITES